MTYRKEKLRRHWMDRPPLPTSPVPCSGLIGGIFGQRTYEGFKFIAEMEYLVFDAKSPRERENTRQLELRECTRNQRVERDKYFAQLASRRKGKP